MNTPLENLLSLLENVSAQAVELTDPMLDLAVASLQAAALLDERATLLNRLHEVLARSGQPSYLDWNRLVIIRHQGAQIEANLRTTRDNLVTQLADNARGRAFLECVTGVVEVQRTPHQINA